MKNRYLFTFSLFLIAGIILSVSFHLNAVLLKLMPALIFTAALILGVIFKKFMPAVAAAALIIGLISGSASSNAAARPLYEYDGKTVSGRLIITDITVKENYSYGTAQVLSINGNDINEKISLFINGSKKFFVNDTAEFEGMKIALTGNPGEALNDGAFDYVLYNRSRGIFFEGSVKGGDMKVAEDFSLSPLKLARNIKYAISQRIQSVFTDADHAGILTGLFVGDKELISDETLGYFKLSGISHILCVSGMHVMLIMSVIGFILSLMGLSQKHVKIFSLILIGIFILISGLSPSSVRAGIMVLAASCASLGRREYDSATALSVAVLIMLIINPLTVYDPSFQLSAGATLGIIALNGSVKRRLSFLPDVLSGGIALTLSAQIGTLPIMILSYGYISAASVIANVAVVTFLPVIYLIGVLAVLSGFYPIVLICGYVLDAVIFIAKHVSQIPFGIIDLPTFAPVIAGTAIFALALVIGGLSVHKRRGVIAAFAAAGIITAISGSVIGTLPSGKLEAYFLNVGQGDCCILRLPGGEYIMIDTGTEQKCKNEVVPYLKRQGVKELEALVLSHSHSDHAGGAALVTDSFATSRVIYPASDNYEFKDLAAAVHSPAQKGDVFTIDGCKISVLSPESGTLSDDKNEYSMIFRLDYGKSSYLFTGDAEAYMLHGAENIDTDVLKVPHHGSGTGLNPHIAAEISPDISVISAGADNSYGHPHAETLEILENSGSGIYRTDRNGMIKIKSDKAGNHTIDIL